MSDSAKKRREKERQRDRRWRNRHTWYRFVGDKFVPEAIGAYALRRAGTYRSTKADAALDVAIRDVEFAAFTDPVRHMYAGG